MIHCCSTMDVLELLLRPDPWGQGLHPNRIDSLTCCPWCDSHAEQCIWKEGVNLFQRMAQRDKKAFFSHQCKEIEENNRMRNTRDLFKKISDTKGTFHANMGTIKDRNGVDLTKQKILRRGGMNTQKNCTKKSFMTQMSMMVFTHLEPDILECEVKWALGSISMIKASGGVGIPVELFQILKDNAVKVLHSICQQIWKNSAVATGLEKVSFRSKLKESQCQRMLKLLHNCTHLTR